MLTQYTTANTLKKLLKRALVKKSGAGPGGVWRSVHNRTNLAKVTPVPEVSTPIQYTTAQTFGSVESYSSTLYLRKACQILWGGKARVNFFNQRSKKK